MARQDWTNALPDGGAKGRFALRVDRGEGPSPALLIDGRLFDMSRVVPTLAELLARDDPADATGATEIAPGEWDGLTLLPPADLQCIKACGVTFADSAVERVIEERARGDHARAAELRAALAARIGGDIQAVKPGSPEAARLKGALIEEGLWSQYLEVAIGPDAEVFTKAPVLSAVGPHAEVGIRSDSHWNNPEPEVVLAVTPDARIVGATLGNDVNLRDIEGRSALLLGKAKDNNASCAIGPAIRLFDDSFGLDDVRSAQVTLTVEGEDGFRLEGASDMGRISRDPTDLVGQTFKEHHYPDGILLFLGTLFAPTQDRDAQGQGFTHHAGDRVTIASPLLGRLENRVVRCPDAAPWSVGIGAFMRNLGARGLLG